MAQWESPILLILRDSEGHVSTPLSGGRSGEGWAEGNLFQSGPNDGGRDVLISHIIDVNGIRDSEGHLSTRFVVVDRGWVGWRVTSSRVALSMVVEMY